MLCVSELSEALEGDRKSLMDDKLPKRRMFEVELADCVIRLLDLAGGYQLILAEYNIAGTFQVRRRNVGADLLRATKLIVDAYDQAEGGQIRFGIAVSKAISGVLEIGKRYDLDVMAAFAEKMEYNATRKDHTHEARLQEGGKKY